MLTFPTLITGTITDLRISSVDGTAFLDNCAALIPYADGNRRIEIYDASGRILQGYLKAQGVAETLATTGGPLNNGELTKQSLSDWSGAHYNATVDDANSFTSSLKSNYIRQTGISFTAGALHKLVHSGSTGTGKVKFQIGTTVVNTDFGTGYHTPTAVYDYRLSNSAVSTTDMTAWSIKEVTAPSTDGVTIVSAKGGAIYNFASKDASFTYNAASYRYAIYDTLKVSRPTRYMGVSTHNI